MDLATFNKTAAAQQEGRSQETDITQREKGRERSYNNTKERPERNKQAKDDENDIFETQQRGKRRGIRTKSRVLIESRV